MAKREPGYVHSIFNGGKSTYTSGPAKDPRGDRFISVGNKDKSGKTSVLYKGGKSVEKSGKGNGGPAKNGGWPGRAPNFWRGGTGATRVLLLPQRRTA
ncbi:hypothetical protein BH11ARM2_BH11ARM2_26400 [soil metagenome]